MDSHAALYTALETIINADTGSGGLKHADFAGRVLQVARSGDPNTGRDAPVRPRIEIEISGQDDRSFARRRTNHVVNFHIFTDRDPGYAAQNAIVARLVTLLDEVTVTAGTVVEGAWAFGSAMFLRMFQGPATGDQLHAVAQLRVRGQY